MREGAATKYTTKFFMYAFLVVVSFISVFPLYWAFISAFNNTQQILGGRMIPSTHLMENLKNLFAQQNVLLAMKNSFATSLLQVVLSLIVSSIAGTVVVIRALSPTSGTFSRRTASRTVSGGTSFPRSRTSNP